MNEKQAKRLRFAEREYVRQTKKELSKGPAAADFARQLANDVNRRFSYLNHRERGKLMQRIMMHGLGASLPSEVRLEA